MALFQQWLAYTGFLARLRLVIQQQQQKDRRVNQILNL